MQNVSYERELLVEAMKVLIGYDGSKFSDVVLDDLKRAGLPSRTEVVLLSIADVFLPPGYGFLDNTPAYLRPRAENWRRMGLKAVAEASFMAEKAAKNLKKIFPSWKIHSQARGDSPAWALLKKSWQWKPDLIVVGTHGKGKWTRFALGSVSQRVLHEAACNVRISRPAQRHGKKTRPRFLIGIDGSEGAEKVCREAVERNWPLETEAHLLTIFPADMKREERIRAKRTLEHAAGRFQKKGLSVFSVVKDGNPADILVREAKSRKVDCIFLGARGLSRIKKFFIGSVSSEVSIKAPCSVEVVKK